MKRRIVTWCVCLLALSASAQGNREGLMRELQKAVDWENASTINDWQTFCDDFDGNGSNELFAVIPSKEDEETGMCQYRSYLVDANGVNSLEDVDDALFCLSPAIAKVPLAHRALSVLGFSVSYGGPGCQPFYWIYDKGQIKKLENCPGGLTHLSGRDFACGTSLTDASYDEDGGYTMGRTWYQYYYYVDDEGRLREYVGKPMSEQWLRSKKGNDQVFSKIREMGGKLTAIFYRQNGVFNVNFSVKGDGCVDFYYLKGKVGEDDTLHFDMDEDSIVFSGTYQAANTPDIQN